MAVGFKFVGASSPAAVQPMLGSVMAPLHVHRVEFYLREQASFLEGKQHRSNSHRSQIHLVNLVAMLTEHPRTFDAPLKPKLRSYFGHPVTKR